MKTKRILSLIVATVMLVSLLAVVGLVNAFAATPIATAEEFMATFSGKETVTGNYTLTASITLPDGYVTPASFSGTLDGGKNTVSGIKTPLFGTLSGEVKNLTLGSPKSESSISSDTTSPIGALANTLGGNLTLDNVLNNVDITASASQYVGGLIGGTKNGAHQLVIKNSGNAGNISGSSCVGGLVGGIKNDDKDSHAVLTIEACTNNGSVTNTTGTKNTGTAGILGYVGNYGEANITKTVNYGKITMAGADAGAAGIVGGTRWDNAAGSYERITVTYSANYGEVSTSSDRGRTAGIVARVNKNGEKITIDHCYNFGAISAMNSTSDGASGIFGYVGNGAISGTVSNCYNVGVISALGNNAAIGSFNDKNVSGTNNYYIPKTPASGSASLSGTAGDYKNNVSATSVSDLNALIAATVKDSTDFIVDGEENGGYPVLEWQCKHTASMTTLSAEFCKGCGIKLRDIENTSTPFDKGTLDKTATDTYTITTEGISGFISYRSAKTGGERDVRFVLCVDLEKIKTYEYIKLTASFYADGAPVKSITLTYDELTLYKTAVGAGLTYVAGEGDALLGLVISDVPNQLWDTAILSVEVSDDKTFAGQATNPSIANAENGEDGIEEIGVMTFNLRYDISSHDLMALGVRGPHLMEIIDKYQPDSIGFNEATNAWMSWLRNNMAQRGYAYVGVGRDSGVDDSSASGSSNEYSPVFYKADKYELLFSDTIWLSKTPETAKTKGWGSEYNRICTYAVLKNKMTGETYAHFSTHLDHKDLEAQENSIYVLETYIRAVLREYGDIGIVLTGDFNTVEFEPDNPDYDAFTYDGVTSFMDDTRYLATELGVIGKSFMGYNPEKWEQGYETDKDKPNIDTSAAPIDFIFVKKGAYTCSYYTIVNDTFTFDHGGKTWHAHPVSDHYGVYAKITCTKPETPFTKDESKLIDHKATISTTKPSGLLSKLTDGISIKSTFSAASTENAIANLLKDDASFAVISVSGEKHGYWEITLEPASDLNFNFNGLSFTTAASDHPFNLRVFASTDGKNWEQIGASYAEKLTNSTTYYLKSDKVINTHYIKLAFTDTPTNAKLANITLYAETVSNGRVAADRITVTAGPSLNSKEGCEKLFDGTTSTKFYKRQYSEGSVPTVREPMDAIFFKTDVAVTITHFNMINGNDTASHTGRIPSAWTLYGSQDGKTYVVIDNETDPELTTDNYAVHGFTVDNPGSYQYYKLVFICGDDGNVQFSEMELYETVS